MLSPPPAAPALGCSLRRSPRGAPRRGPAADLPRGAEERPAARRRARELGSHAGEACRRRARACCRTSPRRRRPTSTTTISHANDRRRPATSTATSTSRQPDRFGVAAACTARRTWSRYDQAKQQVTQSDYTLALAQQDLIIRMAVAYFDVLLAEFNVELAEQQKLAVAEQLAQAKRNFEVGTATITDTNEAQAKYDRSSPPRSRRATTSTAGARRCARSSARFPQSLKRVGRGFEPDAAEPEHARLLGRQGASTRT